MNIQEKYQRAVEILDARMIIDKDDGSGEKIERDPLDAASETKVREAVSLLKDVVRYNPHNWSAYWMLGKAYQLLDEHENQFEAFRSSQLIVRSLHPVPEAYADVLRELVLACLATNRLDYAIYYADTAIKFRPADATLWSNYAITLLLGGKLDNAETWARNAAVALPGDTVAVNVLALVDRIRAGQIEQPKTLQELMQCEFLK